MGKCGEISEEGGGTVYTYIHNLVHCKMYSLFKYNHIHPE